MATSEISNDPSVDYMLDILWKNRDQMDVDIPLTHDKGRRKVFKAIRGQATKHNKQISDAQLKTIENCIEMLRNGHITSWEWLIKYFRGQKREGAYKIDTIIESIYSLMKNELVHFDEDPSSDEADHSKIIEPLHILKRNPSLKDTIQDLFDQIDSIKSSPDEKNNINLYEELVIILKLMLDILSTVETHQDGNVKTGEDLLQGIVDLQDKIQQLHHWESEVVETELMRQEYNNAQEEMQKLKNEIRQKDSKIESLKSEMEKRAHQLLSKDGDIKSLIAKHEKYVKDITEKHEKDVKDINKKHVKRVKVLNQEHKETQNEIIKDHKKEFRENKDTISKLLQEHREERKELYTKLKKRDNVIDQHDEKIHKLQVKEKKPAKETNQSEVQSMSSTKPVQKPRRTIAQTVIIPDFLEPDLAARRKVMKQKGVTQKVSDSPEARLLQNIASTSQDTSYKKAAQSRKPQSQSKDKSTQLLTLIGKKTRDINAKSFAPVLYAFSFDRKLFAECEAFKEIRPAEYTPKHTVFSSIHGIDKDISYADYIAYAYKSGTEEPVADAYCRNPWRSTFEYNANAKYLAMCIRDEIQKNKYPDCVFCLALIWKGKKSKFPPKELDGQFVQILTNDLIKELRA